MISFGSYLGVVIVPGIPMDIKSSFEVEELEDLKIL